MSEIIKCKMIKEGVCEVEIKVDRGGREEIGVEVGEIGDGVIGDGVYGS
ncbi:hypothetical protein [Staphylococcus epidermidis]|nr:hypothetical protein [Staphylococcus epidermidis]